MMKQENQFTLSKNIDAKKLIGKYGSPLYVYDSAIIKRQFDRISNAFDVSALRVNYACKANTNLSILRLLKSWGSGLDTVSIQEVELGLQAGFSPQDILFTPSGISMNEMEAAVNLGVRINIDNISILEQFGHQFPEMTVGIRVNPHVMAGGNSKISVGHLDSKFGISIHQMPYVHKVIETLGIKIDGIHMHTGSDILNASSFLQAADILLNTSRHFKNLNYIDFGSGFKVPYKPGDVATDIEDFGEQLGQRFNEFCKNYGKELTLMFEPGKFLVSESGYFLATCNVVKSTPAATFVGLDTGLNHLIRPMMYNAYHHITNVSNPNGKVRIYSVVGYICETDTFGVNRQMNEVHEGDIICMHNAGAYCFSMASNYNSRFRPAEVIVHEGKSHLIRKRETMDDLRKNLVDVFGA